MVSGRERFQSTSKNSLIDCQYELDKLSSAQANIAIPNTRLAECMQDAKEDLTLTTSQLNNAFKLLSEMNNRHDDCHFSNKVLHAKVNKQQQCEQLLAKLASENQNLQNILKNNQAFLEQKKMEAMNQLAELADRANKLMFNLKLWQDTALKTRLEYEKAEEDFERIKQKIKLGIEKKKEKNPYDKESLAKEYTFFLQKHGAIARLANFNNKENFFEKCESVKSLPLHNIALVNIDFAKKTLLELWVLAGLSEDAELLSEAKKLISKIKEYNTAQVELTAKAAIYIKPLNKELYTKLVSEAGMLVDEYALAVDELIKESRFAIDDIEMAQTLLLSDVTLAGDAKEGFVQRAKNKFEDAHNQMLKAYNEWRLAQGKRSNPKRENTKNDQTTNQNIQQTRKQFEQRREVIFKEYEAFNKACDNGKQYLRAAYTRRVEIAKKNSMLTEKFGIFRYEAQQAFRGTSENAMDNLNNLLDESKEVLEKNKEMIASQKALVLQVECIGLIRKAIENNIVFWNQQISCFGSWYSINNVKVPHGIAQLYKHLQFSDDYSSEEMLKIIKSAVEVRKKVGIGLFARRQVITDRFYDLIKKTNLKALTDDTFKDFKADLAKIGVISSRA